MVLFKGDYRYAGNEEKNNYSNFLIRITAWLIDFTIVFGSLIFIKLIPDGTNAITSLLFYNKPIDDYILNYWVIQIAMVVVVFWLYFALMESLSTQGTVGKMIVGIKVVNEEEEKLSFANSSGRFFLQLISLCLLGIGHIFVLFTERKRAVHDILSRSIIIKR
jgi:uncharacterized RDD family membrane protein YckC